ncbi:MAG: IS21 family transposase [Planctomycetota bacterium]
MANVLSEQRKQEVLALGRLGWSLRKIEEATGIRRETASNYLKQAGVVVRGPRQRRLSKAASEVSTDSSKAASGVSTDSEDLERSSAAVLRTESACEPHREFIEHAVSLGRNAAAIWQDLVDDHGFTAKYPSVMRFVRRLRSARGPEAHPVIITSPGEECQVDYGEGPMVRHPETKKFRRTRLFVLTLGFSRKSVRLLTFRSSSRIWAELHERAFRRLGGATRVVVLDNLKEGVIKPEFVDPTINPLYRDLLTHYGAIALPARVRHPNRKGKVESAVKSGQDKLRGLRFETLEEAQAYLDRWETNWADTRIHGTTKRQVSAMFADEKPTLVPLPLEPFAYYEFGKRVVHLDGCVEVQRAFYGTPPGWVGRDVHVQWDGRRVRILDPRTSSLLREHLRERPGRYRIEPRDKSKKAPPGLFKLRDRARVIGRSVETVCAEIFRNDGPTPGIRRIQGTLGLAKKYGHAQLESACAFALETGAPSYRFVKSYLEHVPSEPLSLRQVDPLIRELTQYQKLLEQRTQGDS